MSRLGKQYAFFPAYGGAPGRKALGTVVWEHPKGRFVVLEYEIESPFGARRLRESVQIVQGALYGTAIDPGRKETQAPAQKRAGGARKRRKGK